MKQILLMMAMVVLVGCGGNPEYGVVEFQIRHGLGKFEGELTKSDFEKIITIGLDTARLTDLHLKEVAKLQNLEELNLSRTKITDAGLKQIANLKKLELLILSDTKITNEGLKEVAKLQNLETLYLKNTKITDMGLKEIANLEKLNWLQLDGNEITDEGLQELAKFNDGNRGGLVGGLVISLFDTKVTKEGKAELRKALPKSVITP